MSTFRVLHVCTGNIARSPMAELLMRDCLRRCGEDAERSFSLSSAGTVGQIGSNIEGHALAALRTHGVDGSAFIARAIAPDLVAMSDLVLTATRHHRSVVVGMTPAAVRRTFTLKEFARLASTGPAVSTGDDPTERAVAVVAGAAQRRGHAMDADAGNRDDIADPYGGQRSCYDTCLAEVAGAVERVVAALVPTG